MPAKRICIIGAGLAGLSAGMALRARGKKCLIFEQESVPGGLCRSRRVQGFTFDRSGHLLHFRDKTMYSLVSRLVAGGLVEHRRSAWVFNGSGFVRYPFQANLYGLPRDAARECLLGFIRARCRTGSRGAVTGSFRRWIEDTFGRGIARHFMLPYNRKFWTVPVSSLTTDWLDGFIPVPSLEEVIEGSLGSSSRQFGYNARFWYPARGGIQALPDALAQRLGQTVQTGMSVTSVDLKKKRLRLNGGSWERYDTLISTMPLPLWKDVAGLPAAVNAALRRLKWTAVRTVNLGVRSGDREERHWFYFPQRNIAFFRCGFSHAFSPSSAPAGAHALYVEFSRRGGVSTPAVSAAELAAGTLAALKRTGCAGVGDRLVAHEVVEIPYAYVIYDRYRAAAVATARRYLSDHDVHCCGRYGAWEYLTMEGTMLQARNEALAAV